MSIVIVRCQISSILECVAHHTPQGHSLQALCGQNKQERPGVHARICPLLLTARYVAHHLGLPARQEVGACCSHHPSGQFCKQCCTSCHQVESALGAERGSRYIRGCGVLLQLARATHSPPFLLPWCGRDASSDWGWPAPVCSWGHPAWPLRSQGTYTPPLAPDALAAAACAAIAVPLATLAAAKAALGDDLHVEFHDRRPYVEWVPVSGSSCCAGALEVTPAPASFA
jgi:hypothetical protein